MKLRAMNSSKNEIKKSPAKRPNIFLRLLGPGLVTGAADDDPSGIATYSQAGERIAVSNFIQTRLGDRT
jgi:Mn2+/Fe2+ NRAMP family transporter